MLQAVLCTTNSPLQVQHVKLYIQTLPKNPYKVSTSPLYPFDIFALSQNFFYHLDTFFPLPTEGHLHTSFSVLHTIKKFHNYREIYWKTKAPLE